MAWVPTDSAGGFPPTLRLIRRLPKARSVPRAQLVRWRLRTPLDLIEFSRQLWYLLWLKARQNPPWAIGWQTKAPRGFDHAVSFETWRYPRCPRQNGGREAGAPSEEPVAAEISGLRSCAATGRPAAGCIRSRRGPRHARPDQSAPDRQHGGLDRRLTMVGPHPTLVVAGRCGRRRPRFVRSICHSARRSRAKRGA
jgi:hypothetical protein